MIRPVRMLALAATLALSATAAHAGGMHATLEGPGRDGRTYTVRTFQCSNPASMAVSAVAEGLVNGERRSVPLQVRNAKNGRYTFARGWPDGGRWVVRLTLGSGNAPATVARLGPDGRVLDQELAWNSDGRRECDTALAATARH